MQHLKLRTAAVITAATATGVLGLAVPAHAAGSGTDTATATASAVTGKKVALRLTPAGKAKVDAARAHVAGSDGAISLLNNSAIDGTFTLEAGGQTLATYTIPSYTATYSQIFPAGAYTLVEAPSTGTTPDTEDFTLGANQDRSEAYYSTTSTAGAFQDSVDAVGSVPPGGGVLSFRNESPAAAAVDVYVNGTKVLPDVAVGATADIGIVPAGEPTITVDEAGTTTPVIDTEISLQPYGYDAFYLLTAPSGASTPYVFTLNGFSQGYAFTASDGGTFNYGSYPFQGSLADVKLAKPVVGGAMTPYGGGDYLVASDGGVFAFNGAPFLGSTGNLKLTAPIVGMATTNGTDGNIGYLLVASDGGVFAYNTPFYGSLGGQTLPAPVVGVSADPTTGEYVMALANGEAVDFSSSGAAVVPPPASSLAKPIVGIALTPDAAGYWLVASDGGVFAFGDADFFGSTGNIKLNQPVTGIVPSYDGLGYNLIAKDGGVFSYGNSRFFGSTGAIKLAQPVVGPIAIP